MKTLFQGVLVERENGFLGKIPDDAEEIPIAKILGDLMLLACHEDATGSSRDSFDFDSEEWEGIGGLDTEIKPTAEAGDVGKFVTSKVGEHREIRFEESFCCRTRDQSLGECFIFEFLWLERSKLIHPSWKRHG